MDKGQIGIVGNMSADPRAHCAWVSNFKIFASILSGSSRPGLTNIFFFSPVKFREYFRH